MLQFIRSKAGSLVVKILFALLIASFAVWGIGDIFRDRSPAETTVASVGSINIQADALSNAVRQRMDQFRGMFGSDFGPEQAKQLGIVNGVLDSLIQSDLLTLEQQRLGIVVDDTVVRDAIFADPHFHNSAGGFDRNLFNNILGANHLTENGYVALMRRDLGRAELTEALTAGASAAPILSETLYRFRNEKRTVASVLIAADSVKGVADPTDAEIADYYAQHQATFRAPEYRGFTALILTPDDIAGTIEVPEDKLKTEYQTRVDEFSTPERRKLEQMILPDAAKANEAAAALAAGKSFEEVAKDIAHEDASAIDLGWVKRDEMLPALADAAFGLKEGEVGKPIESPLGWHIFKATGAEAGATKPFDEVRAQIATDVAREMASEKIYQLANQLEDSLAGGSTLEQLAEQFKLKLTTVAAVDPDGKDPKGAAVAIPASEEVLKSVFETAQGQTSRLAETHDNGYFVVRTDKVTPSAVRPLDEVKDPAKTAWLAEKRNAAAEAIAKEIEAALTDGKTLEDVAATKQDKVETIADIARAGGSSGLPAELVAKIFGVKPGQTAVAAGPKGWYVTQLKSVQVPDPATDKDGVTKLASELTNGVRADILGEFDKALRARFPVEIHQDLVDKAL
jgi:peptidyl-prolyl cis-trans isomerase D